MTQLVQCIPNFSEGRRPEVIRAIVSAIRAIEGVRVADWSADVDHNRMVVTFVGAPGAVCEAAVAACGVAMGQIDLRSHVGVHPRLGALDVLPLVPLREITLAECADYACVVGKTVAKRYNLPVFLYEAASDSGRSLPQVRKEAFRTLRPDFGPSAPHATAGAVVVGARNPLIAYNINLASPEIDAARTIARELRDGTAGFAGVRALAMALGSRNLTQVSMNITRTEATSLLAVFDYVTRRAAELGTTTVESEVIGAMPGYSGFGVIREALKASGLKPGQVLFENWPDE